MRSHGTLMVCPHGAPAQTVGFPGQGLLLFRTCIRRPGKRRRVKIGTALRYRSSSAKPHLVCSFSPGRQGITVFDRQPFHPRRNHEGRHQFLQTVDIVFLTSLASWTALWLEYATGIQHEQGPRGLWLPTHSLYPGSVFTDTQGATFILTLETPCSAITLHLSLEVRYSFFRFIISAGNINRHAPSVFPKSRYSGSPRDLALISQRAMSIPLIVLVLIPLRPVSLGT